MCAITNVVAHTFHLWLRKGTVIKMKSFRPSLATVLASVGMILLSACTPPMPPEFMAELADRYVTCIDGAVSISAPSEFIDVAQTWVDGLSESCTGFTGTIVDSASPADVIISESGVNPSCSVLASSPVGLDAVAISVTVDGLDGVIFTPALLHKALSGQMTSWADPELQDLNPDLELIDSPLILRPSVRTSDLMSINDWMSRLDPVGWPGTPSGLVVNDLFDPEVTSTEIEAEGTISVLPASFALAYSAQTIRIQTDVDQEPVGLNSESIYSAGTQYVSQVSDSIVTAKIDPTISPIPPAGSDEAALPWQALNPYKISVCSGANEMSGRAFARFALRLESQGALTEAGFTELPEQIRTAGVDAVSQGLPEPTIPPTDAPAEVVPTEFPSDEPTDMPAEVPMEEATDAATPEPTS